MAVGEKEREEKVERERKKKEVEIMIDRLIDKKRRQLGGFSINLPKL